MMTDRLHECSVCKTRAPWSRTWQWYGSWTELEAGKPQVKTCSSLCRKKAAQTGLVPTNAPLLDDE
jgi:hypothetical protein